MLKFVRDSGKRVKKNNEENIADRTKIHIHVRTFLQHSNKGTFLLYEYKYQRFFQETHKSIEIKIYGNLNVDIKYFNNYTSFIILVIQQGFFQNNFELEVYSVIKNSPGRYFIMNIFTNDNKTSVKVYTPLRIVLTTNACVG